ncbi:GTPase activation, GAP [Pelomyxa schiedti]|nr:GTPase activation, GAP [Pelomyxa schiedti]
MLRMFVTDVNFDHMTLEAVIEGQAQRQICLCLVGSTRKFKMNVSTPTPLRPCLEPIVPPSCYVAGPSPSHNPALPADIAVAWCHETLDSSAVPLLHPGMPEPAVNFVRCGGLSFWRGQRIVGAVTISKDSLRGLGLATLSFASTTYPKTWTEEGFCQLFGSVFRDFGNPKSMRWVPPSTQPTFPLGGFAFILKVGVMSASPLLSIQPEPQLPSVIIKYAIPAHSSSPNHFTSTTVTPTTPHTTPRTSNTTSNKANTTAATPGPVEILDTSSIPINPEHILLCTTCHQNARSVVLMPCMHILTCRDCSSSLTTCPVDALLIQRKLSKRTQPRDMSNQGGGDGTGGSGTHDLGVNPSSDEGAVEAGGLVLPPSLMSDLQRLILPGVGVVAGVSEFLWVVCKALILRETSLHLCDGVLRLLESTGCTTPFLAHTITTEIQETSSAPTLFRSNCVATRLVSQYFKLRGAAYLKHCLSHIISTLQSEPSLEVDIVKLQQASNANVSSTPGSGDQSFWESKAKDNAIRVVQLSQRLFDHICNSVDQCPMNFRVLFAHAKQQAQHKFPAAASLVVGGFVFLRFLCPAIVAPEAHGLLSGSMSQTMRRNLVLVSKLLQTLANGVTEGLVSHPAFTAFLTINCEACSSFYTNLTSVAIDTTPTATSVTPYALMTDDLTYIFTKVFQNIEIFNDSAKDLLEMRKQVQELVNSATVLEKGNKLLTKLFKKYTKAAAATTQAVATTVSPEEALKKDIASKLDELTCMARTNNESETMTKIKKMQQEIEQLKKDIQIERDMRLKLGKEVDKKHGTSQIPRLFSKGISTSSAVEAVTKFEPLPSKELATSANQRTPVLAPLEFSDPLSTIVQKPAPPQLAPLVPSPSQIHFQNSTKQFQDLNLLIDAAFQRIDNILMRMDDTTVIYKSIILTVGTVMKDLTRVISIPFSEPFEATPVAALQSAAIGSVTPDQVEHLMKISARVLGQCREYVMNTLTQDLTLSSLPSLIVRAFYINNMLESCCTALGFALPQPALNFPPPTPSPDGFRNITPEFSTAPPQPSPRLPPPPQQHQYQYQQQQQPQFQPQQPAPAPPPTAPTQSSASPPLTPTTSPHPASPPQQPSTMAPLPPPASLAPPPPLPTASAPTTTTTSPASSTSPQLTPTTATPAPATTASSSSATPAPIPNNSSPTSSSNSPTTTPAATPTTTVTVTVTGAGTVQNPPSSSASSSASPTQGIRQPRPAFQTAFVPATPQKRC